MCVAHGVAAIAAVADVAVAASVPAAVAATVAGNTMTMFTAVSTALKHSSPSLWGHRCYQLQLFAGS